jgi:hypothetical protein
LVRSHTYARLRDVVEDIDQARVLVGFHFRNSDLQGSALAAAGSVATSPTGTSKC